MARGMTEGIRTFEALTCPLDGLVGTVRYSSLQDRFFNVPGQWTLAGCSQCGWIWLNPRPIPEDIGKLYEHYFTHDSVEEQPRASRFRGAVRDAALGYDRNMRGAFPKLLGKIAFAVRPIRDLMLLSVMTLSGSRGKKLLDVGCGNGSFLAKMQRLGWDVVGVETDPKAAGIARERFGLKVHVGDLTEAGFADQMFDALTMSHVLEHVPDPVHTLHECARLLKPGGKLVVVTPNWGSLGHRALGRAWPHLDPPRHLHLFSLHSVRQAIAQTGLQVLRSWTSARLATWTWIAGRQICRTRHMPGGSLAGIGRLVRLEGIVFRIVEDALCSVADVGEEIVVEAKV